MAKMLLVDSLKELRTIIDQQHLLYLEFDENPQKIGQRDKLEGYIKEYLCLAPHSTKFTFQETAEVLHQSASTKSNFSAYKAAVAWKAIGKYADNLISHPWRKEYRSIKLYCGFYKHEIDSTLAGAEHMFEVMGYRPSGHSSLVLHGILDPDRITCVSKDAILAYVECQIMKQIWESLSAQFNVTWLEILEFRENHIGTPDQVINSITHKYSQKQYQEKVYQRSTQSLDNHSSQPDCIYRPNSLGYFVPMAYPTHSCPVQIQSRYGPIIPPQTMLPVSSPYSAAPLQQHNYVSAHTVIKPHDLYPPSGPHRHSSHYVSQLSMPTYNHGSHQMDSPLYPTPSVVPTGQLIEFDSVSAYNGSEPYFYKANAHRYNCFPEELVYHQATTKNDDNALTLSGKAKDDGAGSWENWDYVYRNLESQGYKKNDDTAMVTGDFSLKINQPPPSQTNSSEIDMDSLIQSDFSEKVRKINLDRSPQIESTSSSRSLSQGNDETKGKMMTVKEKMKLDLNNSRENVKTKGQMKQVKTSPEKNRKDSGGSTSENNSSSRPLYAKVNVAQKKESESQMPNKDNDKGKKTRAGDLKPLKVDLDDVEDEEDDRNKWQCITCTYLNSSTNNVCEMCCKSKERGPEFKPQPSGGRECYQCTLVNKPGLNFCSACNAYLKDSPTYI